MKILDNPYITSQLTIILLIMSSMYMITFKKKSNMKTLTPFECGFNTMLTPFPVNIQFSLLVFIFLVFDVELSILISANWTITNINSKWITTMMVFILSMIISLLYETNKKALFWY